MTNRALHMAMPTPKPRSNRFRVIYRYRLTPTSGWTYATRSGDVSMWAGPPSHSETAVASWLRSYHKGAEILIDWLTWEGE